MPEPSQARSCEVVIGVPLETATKAALFAAVAATGDSRIAIARALRMDEKEIRRMLDPRHSSKLPRVARVLKALGKELRVTMVDVSKPPQAREPRAGYKARAGTAQREARRKRS